MPLLRYFMYVGGALLALLLISDVLLPQVPLPGNLTSASDLPAVRIRSQQKWPDRVVIDTTIPLPATEAVKVAKVDAASQSAAADTTASVRDAFAQLPPAQQKQSEKKQSTSQKVAAMTEPDKAQVKPQPKRKVAKARPAGRPMMMVAQQPHFGFFNSGWNSTW